MQTRGKIPNCQGILCEARSEYTLLARQGNYEKMSRLLVGVFKKINIKDKCMWLIKVGSDFMVYI